METSQKSGELEPGEASRPEKVWTFTALAALGLAVAPLVNLATFLGLVVWARVQNGRWPQFGDRCPHLFGHDILHLGSLGLILFWVFPIVTIAMVLFGRWRERDFPVATVILCTAFAAGIAWGYYAADPGGFVNWLRD